MAFSKPLRFLSESLRSQIRSGLSLSSLVQCVEELVMNSIDAGANQITIHVDIPHLSIKVHNTLLCRIVLLYFPRCSIMGWVSERKT